MKPDHAGLLAAIGPLPDGASVPVGWVRSFLDPTHVRDDELDDLTLEEAGVLMKRAVSTVRVKCQRGEIPGAYKMNGREWRIPRQGLREYLARQRAGVGHAEDVPTGSVDLGSWRGLGPEGA